MIFKSVKYKTFALLALLALGCAGCHHSDDPCPPGGEEPDALDPDQVMLCLNVSFDDQDSQTRAGNDPDDYVGPEGDFEKISTLRVIILRDVSGDGTSGIVEANRLVMTNDEGRPLYDNLEFKVIANEKKRIYLIANEEYIQTAPTGFKDAKTFLDSFKAKNNKGEAEIVTDLTALTDWTVNVPGLTESTTHILDYGGGLFAYTPSRRLPLSEYFEMEVNRAENDPDDTFFAHLFMTRAAAKAMFYLTTGDNFSSEVNRNTFIQAISLSGVGSTEYVFPHDAKYNPSKESLISVTAEDYKASAVEAYIEDFSTPTDNRNLTYVVDGLNVEIKKPAENTLRPIIQVPIYFPESILQPGEHYKVGVQLNTGEWLYADLVKDERDVPDAEKTSHNILSIVKDGVACNAIARNTYLPIEIKFDGAMNLTVNVLPWDREDHYVDFSANVGITNEGCLDFKGDAGQTGDYLLLDKTAGQLVLNYGKTVQGSFTISSPLGYTWDAYLITTGGTQDAIQFEIPDPNDASKKITTTHISGEIGKEAKFGIVATVAPGSEQNSAQLIVMATLSTGTQVIVDVLRSWNSEKGILTVIENPI